MQRTALVTGASSGIGAAVANLLCERGFDVFGTTRSNNPVSQKFQMISLNVDSDSSVLECVGKVLSKNERVDVLVNNAGYALMGAAEETSIAEAGVQFETNFFGVARMVNAVLPAMRKAGMAESSTSDRWPGSLPFHSAHSIARRSSQLKAIRNRCGMN